MLMDMYMSVNVDAYVGTHVDIQLANMDAAVADPEGDTTADYLDLDSVRHALNVPGRDVTGNATHNQPNTTRGLWLGFDGQISQVPKWPMLVQVRSTA